MNKNEQIAPSPDHLTLAVVNMAIESWRFGKVFERLLTRLDAGEQGRYLSQARWFIKKVDESLDTAGLWLVNIEGQRFDTGMAAKPINLGEFDAEDTLVVDQMVEPIIMGKQGVVRMGTVTVRKVGE